ncbi:hypothetical protein GAYE_PCTG69G1405 [Galdieria yellowstonensis]|uniref:SAM domain-containing protein n=1 Tax=Galdieria yellowstonensis TaxID=3028027 RepID=A0AAV9I841_9RHOD|nr:hypothetical protein GAYE_PCTG69G1405 [Galdieria yellowstonensis]
MIASFVPFCSCRNLLSYSGLLSEKRADLQLSPCLRRNQISSPCTSLFTRRTREKLWWNFSRVPCASSRHSGVFSDPSSRKELVRMEESKNAASSSGLRQRCPSKDTSLKWSWVNRSAAVHQILRNFKRSYSPVEQDSSVIRPAVSYAPQMYGSGKTTVGLHFRTFVLLNRAYLAQRISEFPGIDDTGESVGERAVEALLNETLYVSLDLRDFPDFKREGFKSTLIKTISEKAVDALSNGSELLAKVLENSENPGKWLNSLFEVTNKRYLFLFIDEIGLLAEGDFDKFPDLDPQREPGKLNVYCLFFRVLSSLLIQRFVICYLAGRSDAIITKQEDAISSRVNLDFVRLDPFSEETTKLFIQGMKTSGGEIVLQLLFPRHPEGPDWFFKQVFNYTGGVPIYVRHVIQVLVDTCVHNKLYNLSERRMRRLVETVGPMSEIMATPSNMKPEAVSVFCTLLLSSILEYRFAITETIYGGSVIGNDSKYILDVANNFGFYYEYCTGGILLDDKMEGEEMDEEDIMNEMNAGNVEMVKLIFPKIVFEGIKEEYLDYLPLRYIYYLSPLHVPPESPSSLGFRFKVIFALILYVRCSLCTRLGELDIFRQSFVENILLEAEKCLVKVIPSFNVLLNTKFSANEELYSPSAWKEFYDKYLSEDGIFLPNRNNSAGPDIIVRVSVPIDASSSTPKKTQSSLTPVSMDTSSKKRRVYLIGIALKCYGTSGVGVAKIKEEVDKFLVPVSSQLELEKNDIWAIQLVVSTSYNNDVSNHFVDKQNWVVDTGKKDSSSSSTPSHGMSYSDSDKEGLRIGRNCQLVVCSIENLEKFLGNEIYDQIEKARSSERESFLTEVTPLSRLIGTLFEHGWARGRSAEPEAYLGKSTEKNIGANRVDSTVKSSSSVVPVRQDQFDWMEFLKTYCDFTESEARECLYALEGFSESEMEVVDTSMLKELGIDDPLKRVKIVAGMASYARKKRQS